MTFPAVAGCRWRVGVSVAYVFVHLLPDLNARQKAIAQTGALGFLEHHVYLIALFGTCRLLWTRANRQGIPQT
jgi:hypothetical protein